MKKRNTYINATFLSIVLHVVLIAALVFGGFYSATKMPSASSQKINDQSSVEPIKAVAIDPVMIQREALKLKRKKENQARKEKEEKQRLAAETQALERQKKEAQEKIKILKEQRIAEEKKVQAAQAKREAEKKALEEKQRVKIEKEKQAKLEKQRQQKLAEQKKAAERMKKEQEEKAAKEAAMLAKKKAAAAKEKARQERVKQEAMLDSLFNEIDSETASRNNVKTKVVAQQVARNAAIFQNMIQQKLRINDSMKGKQCQLSLNLSNNGVVYRVEHPTGDAALCSAAQAAVLEVGQFPMPTDPAVVKEMKNIRLVVEPR